MRTKYFRHWTCDNCDKKVEDEYLPNGWREYEFKRMSNVLEIHLCGECNYYEVENKNLIKWLGRFFGFKTKGQK